MVARAAKIFSRKMTKQIHPAKVNINTDFSVREERKRIYFNQQNGTELNILNL